jgi:hypothetical protein
MVGRLNRTRAPGGGPATRISPPCASTIARQIVSPRPVPPSERALPLLPRKNGSKTRSHLLGFEARVELADGLPELAEWVASRRVVEGGDGAISELRALGLVT